MTKERSRRWLRWQTVLAGTLVALVAAALLGWFFPAAWAIAWLSPRLSGVQITGVHGLAWNGRADTVRLRDGRLLGAARWQVSRRVLLSPQPLVLELAGPQLAFSGQATSAGGLTRWDQLHLQADLALWRPRQPPKLGLPRGQWEMTADHLAMQAGWPLHGELLAHWRDASLRTAAGEVALGDLQVRATANGGVIDARLDDVGSGPLQVSGTLRLTPLGWKLDAWLRARSADPALHRWLLVWGKPDASGRVHLQRIGGLAALAAPRAADPAPSSTSIALPWATGRQP